MALLINDDTAISLLDGNGFDCSETVHEICLPDDNGTECFEKYQHTVIYVTQNYHIKLVISLYKIKIKF